MENGERKFSGCFLTQLLGFVCLSFHFRNMQTEIEIEREIRKKSSSKARRNACFVHVFNLRK